MAQQRELVVTVAMRPVDPFHDGWVMGDDVPVTLDANDPISALVAAVLEAKRIPESRLALFIPPDRPIEPATFSWTLRRFGIYDGSVVEVRPTAPHVWLWHPLRTYEERLIEAAEAVLRGRDDRCLALEVLAPLVFKPPCLTGGLKSFLRKYPDRFHMETDVVARKTSVTVNANGRVPTWV